MFARFFGSTSKKSPLLKASNQDEKNTSKKAPAPQFQRTDPKGAVVEGVALMEWNLAILNFKFQKKICCQLFYKPSNLFKYNPQS